MVDGQDDVATGADEAQRPHRRRVAGDLLGPGQVVGDDHAVEAEVTAQHGVDDERRERGRGAGVEAAVDRGRHHHDRDAGVDGRPERPEVGVVARGHPVGDPGPGVGVGVHPAEAGEVLDGGDDATVAQPRQERDAVPGHGPRGVAELPVVASDRRVVRGGLPARDGVHHGRQVEVDPRLAELPGPLLRGAAEPGGRPAALHERGRHVGEPRPLEHLDQPALLVGGHEQPDTAGRPVGDLGAHRARHPGRRGEAVVAATGEHHVADVEAADLGLRRHVHLIGRRADHEQLAHPLRQAHPGERLLRRGLHPGVRQVLGPMLGGDRGQSTHGRREHGRSDGGGRREHAGDGTWVARPGRGDLPQPHTPTMQRFVCK